MYRSEIFSKVFSKLLHNPFLNNLKKRKIDYFWQLKSKTPIKDRHIMEGF